MLLSSCADSYGQAINVPGASGQEIAAAAGQGNLNQLQTQRNALIQSIASTQSQRNSFISQANDLGPAQTAKAQADAIKCNKGSKAQKNACSRNKINQQNSAANRIQQAQAAQAQLPAVNNDLAELQSRLTLVQAIEGNLNLVNQLQQSNQQLQQNGELCNQELNDCKESNKQTEITTDLKTTDLKNSEEFPAELPDDPELINPSSCFSTDGGVNLRVKGESTDNQGGHVTEECYDDSAVWEAFCTYGERATEVVFPCSTGRDEQGRPLVQCEDGACKGIDLVDPPTPQPPTPPENIAQPVPATCLCEASLKEQTKLRLYSQYEEQSSVVEGNMPDSDELSQRKDRLKRATRSATFVNERDTPYRFEISNEGPIEDPLPSYFTNGVEYKYRGSAEGSCDLKINYEPYQDSMLCAVGNCKAECKKYEYAVLINSIGYELEELCRPLMTEKVQDAYGSPTRNTILTFQHNADLNTAISGSCS